ncbi:hypothetical protein [Serratia proteamaculans]|uniref:hypothetical protein n=1 Tax=Serratia proteamaculans TaxID=28151 RepID=UPI0039AF5604
MDDKMLLQCVSHHHYSTLSNQLWLKWINIPHMESCEPMTIYFYCNDNFFTDGALALLKANDIVAKTLNKNDEIGPFNSNDVIILETTCNLTIKNIVIQASHSRAIVLLVLNTPCHMRSVASWSYKHFSKKIEKNLLVKLIRYITTYSDETTEDLNLCEIEIMELLASGAKADEISLSLNMSMKLILECKKTALLKMGLYNDNSLYLLNYKRLIYIKYYHTQ